MHVTWLRTLWLLLGGQTVHNIDSLLFLISRLKVVYVCVACLVCTPITLAAFRKYVG
jgi:hypothetical protein